MLVLYGPLQTGSVPCSVSGSGEFESPIGLAYNEWTVVDSNQLPSHKKLAAYCQALLESSNTVVFSWSL